MNQNPTLFVNELAEHRNRVRNMQQRLDQIDATLRSLGVVLWTTDRQLRLEDTYGIVSAEPYINRPIRDLYRDLFDVADDFDDPLAAHRDAVEGHGVTLCVNDASGDYAMIIEPKRDAAGDITGTVGISIALGRSAEFRA
jgi:hypothetical protein